MQVSKRYNEILLIPEILYHILRYVPSETLRSTILVNKHWHHTTLPFLFQNTTYKDLQRLGPDRQALAAKGVRSLDWDVSRLGTGCDVEAHFPRLKTLTMSEGGERAEDVHRIEQMLAAAPNLEVLEAHEFEFRRSSEAILRLLYRYLERGKLSTFRLVKPHYCSCVLLAPILNCTEALSKLLVLEITGRRSIFEKLAPTLESIQELSLAGTTEDIAFIGDIPKRGLNVLEFDFKIDTPISYKPLLDLELGTLRILDLRCASNDLSEDDLVQTIAQCSNISELYLSIDDQQYSMASMNAIGMSCLSLKYLHLPEGAYQFVNLVAPFPRLETLDFGLGRIVGNEDPDVVYKARRVSPLLPHEKLLHVPSGLVWYSRARVDSASRSAGVDSHDESWVQRTDGPQFSS